MKLLYVAFVSKGALGVRHKIERQLMSAEKVFDSVDVIYDQYSHIFTRLLIRYWHLLKIFFYGKKDTVYYIRQQSFIPFLSLFFSGKNFIYEINAYLPHEKNTLNFWKSKLIQVLSDDHRCLERSIMNVFISRELQELYGVKNFSVVCSNSIFNLPKRSGEKKNKVNRILFVGNEDQLWQGVDLVKIIAQKCNDIKFRLIGKINENYISDNVELTGMIPASDLPNFTDDCDLALSSLAFERSGLFEASPLKSRLYIENNLPVVGGYLDTEFQKYPFYHQIKNVESMSKEELMEIFDSVSQFKPSKYDLSRYLSDYKEYKKFRIIRYVCRAR